jgi:hypothetical protein
MPLKVFKQTTYEGCLPVSLLILGDVKSTKQNELKIIYSALRKYRNNFYTLNILTAFVEIYNLNANLYVDNFHFSKYLKNHSKNKNIKVLHQKINQNCFEKIEKPFALYVDDYILGEESHSQHFIVVEKIENNLATIIDPWPGIRRNIKIQTLIKASENMWNQFLYCPLLITLEEYNNE